MLTSADRGATRRLAFAKVLVSVCAQGSFSPPPPAEGFKFNCHELVVVVARQSYKVSTTKKLFNCRQLTAAVVFMNLNFACSLKAGGLPR